MKQVAVPWARSGSGFALLFEALVLAMAAAARLIREHDTRIWRIIHHPRAGLTFDRFHVVKMVTKRWTRCAGRSRRGSRIRSEPGTCG